MPSTSKRITFNRSDIFGTNFSKIRRVSDCVVLAILEHLELNGQVKIASFDAVDRRTAWLYIYYIWMHNKDNPSLSGFMNNRRQTSAILFINAITAYLHERGLISTYASSMLVQYPNKITVSAHLIPFVNSLINQYEHDPIHSIRIPAFDKMYNMVLERLKRNAVQTNNTQILKKQSVNSKNITINYEQLNSSTGITRTSTRQGLIPSNGNMTVKLIL